MDVYGYYMRVPMCLWTPGRACLIKLELVADWYRKRLRMIRVWECGSVGMWHTEPDGARVHERTNGCASIAGL